MQQDVHSFQGFGEEWGWQLLEETNEEHRAHHRYCILAMIRPAIVNVIGKFFLFYYYYYYYYYFKSLFGLVLFCFVSFFL
jgi:hypothetical protein